MKNLDATLLQKFLDLASAELKGQWLLIGGTLLPAVGIEIRGTVDIDLVGLGKKEKNQTLELMTLAEKLGLSVEAINQAALFFVEKERPTKEDLIILRRGKKATIYRPTVDLYWRLKLRRLSDADAIDCQHYLDHCLQQKDKMDLTKLKKKLDEYLKKEDSGEKKDRLLSLKSHLSKIPR
jgi:hypothetical protein